VNVKGVQKTSLIDFPGTISTVLFSGGCNFRCKYCYNPDLACDNSDLPIISNKGVLDTLTKRKALIDGVVLSGGEPLMRKDLKSFITKIKDLGLKIKLDTNGFYPNKLKKILEANLIDYLAIDIKTSPEKYPALTGCKDLDLKKLAETIKLAKTLKIPYELRTTCIPGFVTEEDIESIKKFVKKADRYYLQQYINQNTLDKDFVNLRPYPQEVLYRFRDQVLTFSEKCEIRGI
jgi:pyruvate formate lyase activating enzyme